MADLKQLDRVALLAKTAEVKAADALAQKQREFQKSSQQLQQLEGFRSEYELRLKAMSGNGISVRQLQDYQQFLGNLNRAISQQSDEVERDDVQVQSEREHFIERSLRRDSLEQLIGRRRVDEQQRVADVEQRQHDEESLRRYVSE
ncbi:MAG: flagellar FliJ protein [Halieaceae bacterium]|jgi:flagellar FliJ protein